MNYKACPAGGRWDRLALGDGEDVDESGDFIAQIPSFRTSNLSQPSSKSKCRHRDVELFAEKTTMITLIVDCPIFFKIH